MKFLLVSKQEVSSSKASLAYWALERFFFRVGAFVSFEMFQTGERARASKTYVWSGLVGLDYR